MQSQAVNKQKLLSRQQRRNMPASSDAIRGSHVIREREEQRNEALARARMNTEIGDGRIARKSLRGRHGQREEALHDRLYAESEYRDRL